MMNKYLNIIFTHFKVLESSEKHHLTQLVAILFLMTAKRQLTVYWQKCELLALPLHPGFSIETWQRRGIKKNILFILSTYFRTKHDVEKTEKKTFTRKQNNKTNTVSVLKSYDNVRYFIEMVQNPSANIYLSTHIRNIQNNETMEIYFQNFFLLV